MIESVAFTIEVKDDKMTNGNNFMIPLPTDSPIKNTEISSSFSY